MSKADAITCLLESGLEEFSSHGYEGASLRDIATRAGVPLSMIHRYFGNKTELFAAVQQRVWAEIDAERNLLLSAALAETPVRLSAVIHALTRPIIARSFGSDSARSVVELMSDTSAIRRTLGPAVPLIRGHDRTTRRFLDAIGLALPGVSQDEKTWGYSFAVGALYSFQLIDHLYDSHMDGSFDPTPDRVDDLLVSFIVGGFGSIARHP